MTDPAPVDARPLGGPVRIVGAGLLGASIGLSLRAHGTDVILDDISPAVVALATEYGAGRPPSADDEPELIVVAVPPAATAAVVDRELRAFPNAIVTDVASVKTVPLSTLRSLGSDLTRYIGSHPMAGRERSGPAAARADLFVGRPWVIAEHGTAGVRARALAEALATRVGATLVEMTPQEHDNAVAFVSHTPQIVSSLMASQLRSAPENALVLASGGVRDVTRVAASDPVLWEQIIAGNAERIRPILVGLRDELSSVIDALESPRDAAAERTIANTLGAGNEGVARLPGKHGSTARFGKVVVLIDDRPGQLAELLATIGEIGINLEDLRLEHSPGAQIGIVEVSVLPEQESRLVAELESRGWRIAAAWA